MALFYKYFVSKIHELILYIDLPVIDILIRHHLENRCGQNFHSLRNGKV